MFPTTLYHNPRKGNNKTKFACNYNSGVKLHLEATSDRVVAPLLHNPTKSPRWKVSGCTAVHSQRACWHLLCMTQQQARKKKTPRKSFWWTLVENIKRKKHNAHKMNLCVMQLTHFVGSLWWTAGRECGCSLLNWSFVLWGCRYLQLQAWLRVAGGCEDVARANQEPGKTRGFSESLPSQRAPAASTVEFQVSWKCYKRAVTVFLHQSPTHQK